jgi:hypothetical protein
MDAWMVGCMDGWVREWMYGWSSPRSTIKRAVKHGCWQDHMMGNFEANGSRWLGIIVVLLEYMACPTINTL